MNTLYTVIANDIDMLQSVISEIKEYYPDAMINDDIKVTVYEEELSDGSLIENISITTI